MKYSVAFYAGSERSKKVELKKIKYIFLAPLASLFFVELFVWSCDIANQRTVLKSVRTVGTTYRPPNGKFDAFENNLSKILRKIDK